jgi:hypothetical protein
LKLDELVVAPEVLREHAVEPRVAVAATLRLPVAPSRRSRYSWKRNGLSPFTSVEIPVMLT